MEQSEVENLLKLLRSYDDEQNLFGMELLCARENWMPNKKNYKWIYKVALVIDGQEIHIRDYNNNLNDMSIERKKLLDRAKEIMIPIKKYIEDNVRKWE